MIAFTNSAKKAHKIAKSMEEVFADSKIQSNAYVCRAGLGAKVISKY
jgi:hypothetical protein